MSEDFTTLNKKTLLDEIGSSLVNLNEFVNDAIETSEKNNSVPVSSMLGLVHQIGYITAIYNQYSILENGLPSEKEPIGFKAMVEKIKNKKEE